MGAYRRDAFDNPAIFVSSVTQLLETFPECVIESVTSPKSGLQTECTWPPGLAEIRARCERSLRQYSSISLNNARRQRVAEMAKEPRVIPDRSQRETVEEICQRNPNAAHFLDPNNSAEREGKIGDKARWVPPTLADLALKNGVTVTAEQLAGIPEFKERTTFHQPQAPPVKKEQAA